MELVPPNQSEVASEVAEVDWLALNSAKSVYISTVLLFLWVLLWHGNDVYKSWV
jgi:hypothetical protein